MALLKSTDAKVVGITFKNSDGTDRQEILSFVSDGDPVTVQYYEFRGDLHIPSALLTVTKLETCRKNLQQTSAGCTVIVSLTLIYLRYTISMIMRKLVVVFS